LNFPKIGSGRFPKFRQFSNVRATFSGIIKMPCVARDLNTQGCAKTTKLTPIVENQKQPIKAVSDFIFMGG